MRSSRVLYTTKRSLPRPPGRRRRVIVLALSAIALIVVAVGVIVAFRTPRWQVRHFEIAGLKAVPEAEVAEAVAASFAGTHFGLIPKTSFFAVDAARLADDLERQFPRLRNVAVSKYFPDSIALEAEERALWAILCDPPREDGAEGPPCFFIDRDGIAFEIAPRSSGALILKIERDLPAASAVGGALIDAELMAAIVNAHDALSSVLGMTPVKISFVPGLSGEMRILTSEGFSIIVPTDGNAVSTFGIVGKVLAEIGERRRELDYVDARFGNKVFYKVRAEEEK